MRKESYLPGLFKGLDDCQREIASLEIDKITLLRQLKHTRLNYFLLGFLAATLLLILLQSLR